MTYTKQSHFGVSKSEQGSHVLVGLNAENITSQTYLKVADSDFNTFTGDYNPRWRSEVKLGQNATTAASGVMYSGRASPFDIYHDWTLTQKSNGAFIQHGTDQSYGLLALGTTISLLDKVVPNSVKTDVTNRCIARFLQEVNKAQTSGNLTGRSIKHFEHDMHSITHPMSELRSSISGYLSQLMKTGTAYQRLPRSLKNGKRLLSGIRAAYLEFQFGISPFVQDITDIVTDLSRDRPDTLKVSASTHTQYNGSVVSNQNLWTVLSSAVSGTTNATFSYKTTSTYSCRYLGAVRTGADVNSGKVSWLQDNNLLPKDWIPTLYHILPYTWMVDYFTNLGDIIDSLAFRFSDLVWTCKTERDYTVLEISPITVSSGFSYTSYNVSESLSASGGSSIFTRSSFNRSPIVPSDLVPQLVLHIPTRPTQYLNMMAAFAPRISKVVTFLTSLL